MDVSLRAALARGAPALEESAAAMEAEFGAWYRGEEALGDVLRAVLPELFALPAAVLGLIEDIGFCKSMMTVHTGTGDDDDDEEDGDHEAAGAETTAVGINDFAHLKRPEGSTPMRLSFCLGEAWLDEEHLEEFEHVSLSSLHPPRDRLRQTAQQLAELLLE